jgi:hypothetical protein
MKKVTGSFNAVFKGNAERQEFIILFFVLLPVIATVVLYFAYKT